SAPAPDFERHLVSSGITLIKLWFSVSQEEQRRRFQQRKVHPLKQWKLSPVDLASLDKWDDYTRAKEAMFAHTDTAERVMGVLLAGRIPGVSAPAPDFERHLVSSGITLIKLWFSVSQEEQRR
ncbi:hypothetical protein CTI14_50770, partial [Methylobacterium radiotolerans]